VDSVTKISDLPQGHNLHPKAFHFVVNPRIDLISDPYMQILEVITPVENFYIVNIYNQADEKGSFIV